MYAYGSEMPIANSSNKTKPVMKTKKTELAKILKMTTGLIFVLIPITIATINPISIRNYQHWLSIYIGLFCSTVIFYVIEALLLDGLSDSPPGEPSFDLFLIVLIYGFLQLLIFVFINGVSYIINVFTNKF